MAPISIEIASAFGPIRLVWIQTGSGPRVQRIVLPGHFHTGGVAGDGREPGEGGIRKLANGIRRFLEGHDVQFDLRILDLDRCPPFQRRVLLAESAIPRGYVSTYGRIARHLGHPSAARAVGNALARNPFPLVIPCHRALLSDGRVGGFQGGREMKRRLLGMEGIRFGEDGRAIMERVWY